MKRKKSNTKKTKQVGGRRVAILSCLWGVSLPSSVLKPSLGLAKLGHMDGHKVCAALGVVYGAGGSQGRA